jgi:hypothetical protein
MAALAHSRAAARCSMAAPAVACSSRSVAAVASSSRSASSATPIAAALRAPRALPALLSGRRVTTPARATRLVCAAAKGYKVALLGAAGGIGQPLALLLKMQPYISQLALYDIANVKGVAADLSHCNTAVQVREEMNVGDAASRKGGSCEERRRRARAREEQEENDDGQLRWGERRSEERSIFRLPLCRSISILFLDESAWCSICAVSQQKEKVN